MVFNKRKEEDEEDREEIDDDVSNLKRLTRDAFSDIKSLREKVHRLETNVQRHSSSSSNSIFHRVKAKVESGFLHPQADENQFNVTASQRVRKGAEMKVNCETHFPKIGHVLKPLCLPAKEGNWYVFLHTLDFSGTKLTFSLSLSLFAVHGRRARVTRGHLAKTFVQNIQRHTFARSGRRDDTSHAARF